MSSDLSDFLPRHQSFLDSLRDEREAFSPLISGTPSSTESDRLLAELTLVDPTPLVEDEGENIFEHTLRNQAAVTRFTDSRPTPNNRESKPMQRLDLDISIHS